MANQSLKNALGSGDSRAVIRAMKAGNAKRATKQAAKAALASKIALAEMYGPDDNDKCPLHSDPSYNGRCNFCER